MAYSVNEPDNDPPPGQGPPPGSGGPAGTGTPGMPNYTPPVSSGSALAVVTTNANYTFTSEQIRAAGGPWPSFRLKVTPVNDNGVGTPQEYNSAYLRVTEDDNRRTTEASDFRVQE